MIFLHRNRFFSISKDELLMFLCALPLFHLENSVFDEKLANVFGSGTMQWIWGLGDWGVQQGLRASLL